MGGNTETPGVRQPETCGREEVVEADRKVVRPEHHARGTRISASAI